MRPWYLPSESGRTKVRVLLEHTDTATAQVCEDYSHTEKCFKDIIRVWLITLSHDQYEAEIPKIEASFKKSQQVRAFVSFGGRVQQNAGRMCLQRCTQ